MTEYNPVALFGDAMTVSLPSTFADVSDIRQVPDNQEVYLDAQGFTSIVFDILERVDKPDIEALKFHLQDIVEEDAGEMKIFTSGEAVFSKLPQGTPAYTLFATTPPGAKRRGRANEPNFVGVLLTMIRLEKQKTDIIVAINVPHIEGEYDQSDVDPDKGKHGPLLEKAIGYRRKILETFEIKDWDLFVQE